MTNDKMTNDQNARFSFIIRALCFLRHFECPLANPPEAGIIPRDVGILVRFSEPPFSTTIQIFRYHGAEFCALAASLVECAGSPFKTSPIPA